VYLGDTARTPYGSKGPATIVRYSRECADFLIAQNIKLLVVACNTASSHALQVLEKECDVPVLGTVEPAVRAAMKLTRNNHIAVIGTEATVASGAYQRRLQELNPSLEITSVACPLFVPLVEQGMTKGEIPEKVVEYYLSKLKEAEADTVVLGCTHYPLLCETIQSYLGPSVTLIESSKAIADNVRGMIQAREMEAGRGQASGIDQFFVTDEVSRFNILARLCLSESTLEAVKVESLEVRR
jgi:glutamate racemase